MRHIFKRALALFLCLSTLLALSPAYGTADYSPYGESKSLYSKDSTIYMRREPKSSTASSNVAAKLTGVKGKAFTMLGESGSYYFAQYEGKQGFVRKKDFSAEALSTGSSTPGGNAKATGGSEDVWGSISLGGTHIDYPIYCNALNSKGTDYYYNKDYYHIFAMSPQDSPIAVVLGHNCRKRAGSSKSMFHDLHHLQNLYLGIDKCEYCGADVSGTSRDLSVSYDGVSGWSLVCFYEVSKSNLPSSSERAAIKEYNALNWGLSGSEKQAWIDQQLSYARSYGMVVDGSVSSSDRIMILITCADKTGSSNQSLYVVLKG